MVDYGGQGQTRVGINKYTDSKNFEIFNVRCNKNKLTHTGSVVCYVSVVNVEN